MNYDNIPQLIKDTGQFCDWKYEQRKDRKTKVPYNALNRQKASVDRPETFVDFKTAVDAVSNYDGIGIRMNNNQGAIDLDHCIENGVLHSWHTKLFASSVMPISKSVPVAQGFVFCFLCQMATDMTALHSISKRQCGSLRCKCYQSLCNVHRKCIAARRGHRTDRGFAMLLDTHMKRPQPVNINPPTESDRYLSDESVMEKAMNAANGVKFHNLWTGDITGYPLIVKQMQNFYKPVKTIPDADFNDDMQMLIILDPADTTKCPWTDIGAGKLFADFYKKVLRYVPERRTWFDYQAGTWSADIGGFKAMHRCMELANLLHLYAIEIKDEHQRKSYLEFDKDAYVLEKWVFFPE